MEVGTDRHIQPSIPDHHTGRICPGICPLNPDPDLDHTDRVQQIQIRIWIQILLTAFTHTAYHNAMIR